MWHPILEGRVKPPLGCSERGGGAVTAEMQGFTAANSHPPLA